MGSRISKEAKGNNCINQINNVNEEELDLSNVDKFQIKAIKHITKELKEVTEKKSEKVLYKLPAIHLCSTSLF